MFLLSPEYFCCCSHTRLIIQHCINITRTNHTFSYYHSLGEIICKCKNHWSVTKRICVYIHVSIVDGPAEAYTNYHQHCHSYYCSSSRGDCDTDCFPRGGALYTILCWSSCLWWQLLRGSPHGRGHGTW